MAENAENNERMAENAKDNEKMADNAKDSEKMADNAKNNEKTVEDRKKNEGNATIQKKNIIQVSNTKRPLFFYLNLAKRYLKQHDEVELSALGLAIPTVVIISEILKRTGIATNQKVMISTVGTNDEASGRMVRKARIEIVLARKAAQQPEDPATEK